LAPRYETIANYRIDVRGQVHANYAGAGLFKTSTQTYKKGPWLAGRRALEALYDEPLTEFLSRARQELLTLQSLIAQSPPR
jgi:hypothetical protein